MNSLLRITEQMKRNLHIPKIDTFWVPVTLFAAGVLFFVSRFFENVIEEHVPHLSAISFLLVAVAFVLVWLGM